MATSRTLRDVFVDELQDVYDAEHQIRKTLPKLIEAVDSSELRQVFENHLNETRGQIERLDKMFQLLEQDTRPSRASNGISGILKAMRKDLIEEGEPGAVRDAALIAAFQRVEHFEASAYGTLAAWALAMGHGEVAALLKDSLGEAKDTDWKLSRLATERINQAAISADGDELATLSAGPAPDRKRRSK